MNGIVLIVLKYKYHAFVVVEIYLQIIKLWPFLFITILSLCVISFSKIHTYLHKYPPTFIIIFIVHYVNWIKQLTFSKMTILNLSFVLYTWKCCVPWDHWPTRHKDLRAQNTYQASKWPHKKERKYKKSFCLEHKNPT